MCRGRHEDAKVGGTFRMSIQDFSSGHTRSLGGEDLELVQNERIRYTDEFDDPNLPGVLQLTVSMKPGSCRADLPIEREGLPEGVPVEIDGGICG